MEIMKYDRDALNGFMDMVSKKYESFATNLLEFENWRNLFLDAAEKETPEVSIDRTEWSKSFTAKWQDSERERIIKGLEEKNKVASKQGLSVSPVTKSQVETLLAERIKYVRTMRIAPLPSVMLKKINENKNELESLLAKEKNEDMKKTVQLDFYKKLLQPINEFEIKEPFTIGQMVPTPKDASEETKKHMAKKREIWFGSSAKEMNIRLGLLNSDASNPKPLKFDDNVVHGAAGGRTGAGKSVMINTILANTLYEYAPWEINLYLADFKIVELMRYATPVATPHVSVVAATSAAGYVVSFFEEIKKEMQSLQDVFAATGFQKLSEFREAFNLVIPRNIILVDEFQQLFRDVKDPKAVENINTQLSAVAALGRATGYHMFLTSQNVGKALAGDLKDNMNMGISLPAPENISNDLIGNGAAAHLKGKGKGIANIGKIDKNANQHFQIPYLISELNEREQQDNDNYIEVINKKYPQDSEDKQEALKQMPHKPYLNDLLVQMNKTAEQFKFSKGMKYYNEGDRTDYTKFEDSIERLHATAMKKKERNKFLDFFMVLGDTTLYKPKAVLELMEINQGDRNNIAIVANLDEELVQITKTIYDNINRVSSKGETNLAVVGDTVFYERFIKPTNMEFQHEYKDAFPTGVLESTITTRKIYNTIGEQVTVNGGLSLYTVASRWAAYNKETDDIKYNKALTYLRTYGKALMQTKEEITLTELLNKGGDIAEINYDELDEEDRGTINTWFELMKSYLTVAEDDLTYRVTKQRKVIAWVFMPDKFRQLEEYKTMERLTPMFEEATSLGIYIVFVAKVPNIMREYKGTIGYLFDRTTDPRVATTFNTDVINDKAVLEGFFRAHKLKEEKVFIVKGFKIDVKALTGVVEQVEEEEEITI